MPALHGCFHEATLQVCLSRSKTQSTRKVTEEAWSSDIGRREFADRLLERDDSLLEIGDHARARVQQHARMAERMRTIRVTRRIEASRQTGTFREDLDRLPQVGDIWLIGTPVGERPTETKQHRRPKRC